MLALCVGSGNQLHSKTALSLRAKTARYQLDWRLDGLQSQYGQVLYQPSDLSSCVTFNISVYTHLSSSGFWRYVVLTLYIYIYIYIYIHGSVHRESNWIIVRHATAFSLLHICRQLYMFRVLTSIVRSSYNCVLTPIIRRSYNCTSAWWWVSTLETCRAVYRYVINWIQSHLVGQLLSI